MKRANLCHITFTGIDARTDVRALHEIQREFPIAEFGVLVSKNWKENGNRFLDPGLIGCLRKRQNEKRLNLALHICGSAAHDAANGHWDKVDEQLTLFRLGLFQRIQLNIAGRKDNPVTVCSPCYPNQELLGNTPGRIDDDFDPLLPTMKVPKAPALDEEPEPGPEPKPKQKSTRLKRPKKEMKIANVHFEMGRPGQIPEQKPMPKKDSGKKKKVDVRLDNGDWFTFDSVSAAAESIGGSSNGLSTALKNNTKFHGHEVRWNNPELDAALVEIDKSNKTPYQPSKPVR